MITQSESGLSAADYAAIQAATEDLSINATIQRYGPVMANHDSSSSRSGSCFDARVIGDYILRAYSDSTSASAVSEVSEIEIERLADETSSDQAWEAITTQAVDIDVDIPISIASSGNTARVFFYTEGGKIQYIECADISAGSPSFGTAQDVASVSDLKFLTATSITKVHYTVQTSENNKRLHFYKYSGGSWSVTDSDIYWPFPIYAMDAETFGDFDLVVLATELAPYLGSRAIGTEVSVEANRVQGIVTFRETDGRWSDHDQIDVIDMVDEDPSRGDVRISYINSTLFVSYLRCGGQDDYTYSKAAVSRSKNGVSWEFPEIFESITPPFVVLPRDDYLYAVGVSKTQRSPCCTWAGQTPTDLDVTEYVTGLSSQAAEIRSSQMALANVEDVLSGTLAKPTDRCQVVYELGYVTGGSALRMDVSVEDVVEWEDQRGMPKRDIAMVTRDPLGRLNRIVSDFAAEWPTMQAGRDAYNDPTGTGYGGLRHTAPYNGSWKANGGTCELISSNMEGLAISTFVSNALNGSAMTSFQLHTASQGEYAGIAFRVYDKDNLHFVTYDLDDDVIYLKKRAAGDDTVLSTSSSMSWTTDTEYWLRVRVHYGWVYIYTSTDGITWSELSWSSGTGELEGLPASGWESAAWTGKFGLVGYIYSDEDEYPDWTPAPWPIPTTPSEVGIIVLSQDQLARCENFFDTNYDATWEDISGDLSGTFYHIVIGPSKQAYVTTSAGLYYTGLIDADTISWTCIKTDGSAQSDFGDTGRFGPCTIDGGGSVYAPFCGPNPGGYYHGGAGNLSLTMLPQYGGNNVLFQPVAFCAHAEQGGAVRLGCGRGGAGTGYVYTVGVGYTRWSSEWGYMTQCADGYVSAWNGNLYSGYSAGGSAIDSYLDRSFGISTLGGSAMYTKTHGDKLVIDGVEVADSSNVFGKYGAVAIWPRNDRNEIAWINRETADGTGAAPEFITLTQDRWINFHGRSGNFFTLLGDWSGASGSDGNSQIATYPLE